MPRHSGRALLVRLASVVSVLMLVLTLVPTWAIAETLNGDSTAPATVEEGLPNEQTAQPIDEGTNDGADVEVNAEDQGAPADVANEDTNETESSNEPADNQANSDEGTPALAGSEDTDTQVHVQYCGHVQKLGWSDYVQDGEEAGTTGQGLRVEALKIKLNLGNSGLTGGIQYRMHVQSYGWMQWVQDDAIGGTEGESKRVEAMQIQLYGEVANEYDVYYAVHAQKKGWMAWASNGEYAGTAAQSLRLEAVKIVLVPKGGAAPSSDFVQFNKSFDAPLLTVKAHVQHYGWMAAVYNGETAGTTGESLRLEALKVEMPGVLVSGTVKMSGHVQGIGWTDYADGTAGTTGSGKRLEAIRMYVDGEAGEQYDIYYRAHVAHLGWLSWAKNDEVAGTTNMSNRIEAVQIKLVPKGGEAPSNADSAEAEACVTGTNLLYKAHCQTIGWQDEVQNGGVAGTTGQNKRLEAFTARISGGNVGGGVTYNAYVSGSGWQGSRSNNDVAGTTGTGKGIEAIQIKLTGRAAKMYDLYYRTHVAGAGWLGWAGNGQTAGAPDTGHSVQAIQICMVPKGAGAPGSTDGATVDRWYFEDPMVRLAQQYSSPTNWLIMVDDERTLLGVFQGSQGNWKLYDMWTVTTGAPDTPSVHGVWSVGSRGYSFGHGYTCYYWTEWNGPYLFHSIKYDEGTFNVQDGRLGVHASMGCVRMPIERAKWIYDNIPSGTTVVVY